MMNFAFILFASAFNEIKAVTAKHDETESIRKNV